MELLSFFQPRRKPPRRYAPNICATSTTRGIKPMDRKHLKECVKRLSGVKYSGPLSGSIFSVTTVATSYRTSNPRKSCESTDQHERKLTVRFLPELVQERQSFIQDAPRYSMNIYNPKDSSEEEILIHPDEQIFKGIEKKWDGVAVSASSSVEDNVPDLMKGRSGLKDVTFSGKLRNVGVPEAIQYTMAKDMEKDKAMSLEASLGRSGSYLKADLWPWPWLNPNLKIEQVFKARAFMGEPSTFHFQRTLLPPPIPILARTLKRYLDSVKPCVSACQYSKTQKMVESFAMNEGSELHQTIIDGVEGEKYSWIKHHLPNYSLTFSRNEAPLTNHAVVAPYVFDFWPKHEGSQINIASHLVEFALEFWKLLYDEELKPPLDEEGHTQCMHELLKLFSSSRRPGLSKDSIVTHFKIRRHLVSPVRHIIVFFHGQIFTLDVIAPDGQLLSSDEIKKRLLGIVKFVEEQLTNPCPGVGVLTSINRLSWWDIRNDLSNTSFENEDVLNEIERALFTVSLDHKSVNDMDAICHEAIFGDGCNRWYDKNLNFYVHYNGVITVNASRVITSLWSISFLLNFIHYRIMEDLQRWDDNVIAMFCETLGEEEQSGLLWKFLQNVRPLHPQDSVITDQASENSYDVQEDSNDTDDSLKLKCMKFHLTDQMRQRIEVSKEHFAAMSYALKMGTCMCEDYPKGIFSVKQINKDAFAHLVIHLTFYRMYHRIAVIISRLSMKRFHHGRYEKLFATTCEALEWCKVWMNPNSTLKAKERAFRKAERKHMLLQEEGKSGRGFGLHLDALRVLCEDHDTAHSAMFMDPSYEECGGNGLVDIYSTVTGTLNLGVILPTHNDGYGIGYSIAETRILFVATSWITEPKTGARLMAASLKRTLSELCPFVKKIDPLNDSLPRI